jgi:hypothetical protein
MPLERPDDPESHLEAVLDYMFLTPLPDEHRDFPRAMVELRSPAAHDEDYRAHFTRHDRFVFERLSLLVEAGSNPATSPSEGLTMSGPGTIETRTSSVPCQVSALFGGSPSHQFTARSVGGVLGERRDLSALREGLEAVQRLAGE